MLSDKRLATFVVPDNFTKISTRALQLCEVFAIKLLENVDLVSEIKVDKKNNLVVSSNQSIKNIVEMYLKAGEFDSFYRQLTALDSSDFVEDKIQLRLIVDKKKLIIRILELSALPNLHLRIVKAESEVK